MEFVVENTGLVGLGITAVLILSWAAWYFLSQHKKTRHERHVEKTIQSLGVEYLKDVALPDGIDGLAFIDYLLLVPKGFVVLDIKHEDGLLFGGTSVDHWTRVVKGKTYKFNNPLYAHQTRCQTAQWNCGDYAVVGRVVFSNAGNFPKGIPKGVSMIDNLKTDLAEHLSDAPISDAQRNVWEQLRNTSIATRAGLPRGAAA